MHTFARAFAAPTSWTAVSLLTLAAAPLIAVGEEISFLITIDNIQEVPVTDSPASGSGTATYDTVTRRFSWEFSFSGLEGAQTAAHFHGPAGLCEEAPPLVSLPLGEFVQGSTVISQSVAADLLAGRVYLNIHSDVYPDGEIRGQIEIAPPDNTIPEVISRGPRTVKFTPVFDGLDAPVWTAVAPNHAARIYVADQSGAVWNFNRTTGSASLFLDTSTRLVPLGIFGEGTYDERGLLGLAFHPDYATNGLLYTYTSEPFDADNPADFSTMPPGSTPNHVSAIVEWRVNNPSDPEATADSESARVLMRIDQPQFNHNGGCLNFGPDGFLYISLGDGGSADDQDGGLDPFGQPNLGHGCAGNSQDPESILGKLLRIDPTGSDSANGQYGIPADNPFLGDAGLDEIWALGFRNPFRFSFDSLTGELYLADVGQNNVEEVNIVKKAGNYGWNVMEGAFRFIPNGNQAGYAVAPTYLDRPDLVLPIAQYDHDEGISVTGGFVYRGTASPTLEGIYVFADYARTFAQDGRLFYHDPAAPNGVSEFNIVGQENIGLFTSGIGQDASGNLYVLGNTNFVPFGGTGVMWRIDPALNAMIEGECPGTVRVAVEGATPNGQIAIVGSLSDGTFVIPEGQPCAGTMLDLGSPLRLIRTARANAEGFAAPAVNLPAFACGAARIQVLDAGSCTPSNVVLVE